MKKIPSPADFERAARLARERLRHIDEIRNNTKQRFQRICPLHDIFLFPERGNIRACVFFKTEVDKHDCERNGILAAITEFLYQEIERTGRGQRNSTTVILEVDSDENVTKRFQGDYFSRLR